MIICKKCNKKAELVTGKYIYPFNDKCKHKNYYVCRTCGDYVGCHKGTTKALGTLANKKLRKKRIQAHRAFDLLWKNSPITRKQAYIDLAKKLNISLSKCHIAAFNLETCNQVLELMKCG